MGLESKVVEEVHRDNEPVIDREKTCPLLLRVFCNTSGRHNSRMDYQRTVPANELQIYTWLDASLKEISRLITDVYPNTKTKGTQFNFAVVYPNQRQGGFIMKDIGTVTIGTKSPDDNSTLLSKKFVIGDYLDVAISQARTLPPPSSRSDRRGDDLRRDDRDRDRDRDRDGRRMRPYPDYR